MVAEKLMGLDPSSPPMTLLLVMLHTGAMAAVIVYFWRQWRGTYFRDSASFKDAALKIILATALTGAIGGTIIKVIEKTAFRNIEGAQIEDLFSHLELIAPALAVAGVLILIAGVASRPAAPTASGVSARQAGLIGAVQALCLPFRGFSRSGATISVGMLAGVPKPDAEAFSFALAVVLTPAVVAREALRLVRVHPAGSGSAPAAFAPGILGAVLAFCRPAGIEMAEPLVRRWTLVSLWYLLHPRCGRGVCTARAGLLKGEKAVVPLGPVCWPFTSLSVRSSDCQEQAQGWNKLAYCTLARTR